MNRFFNPCTTISRIMLATAAIAFGTLSAWGQHQNSSTGLDVTVTYSPMLANVTTSKAFWMHGGSIQLHDQFWRGLGITANIVALHTGNMQNSGIGLDLTAYTAGPRYTWAPVGGKMSYFGEALGGLAHGANSIFPTGSHMDSSGNSVAMQLGGGVDLRISRHLMMRALEADWLQTRLPNATTDVQNNLRLGAGVGYKF